MTTRSRWTKFAAWLGMLALAVAAMLPAGIASATSGETVVLCTAQGTVTVPIDQGGTGGSAADHAHCVYCVHAPPMALLGGATATPCDPPAFHPCVLGGGQAARGGRTFNPEQPRAPPDA